jgi:hypothetical protein
MNLLSACAAHCTHMCGITIPLKDCQTKACIQYELSLDAACCAGASSICQAWC